MAKQKMEDMKRSGVKITNISRSDIGVRPTKKVAEKVVVSSPITKDKDLIPELTNHVHEREPERRLPSTPSMARKPRKLRRSIFIIFFLCLLLGGVYWYGNMFQNAKITLTEKHQTLVPDQVTWTASKGTTSPIHFEIMIIPETELKEVTLTQSQTASIKARGDITLYNEYSTKPQTIAINSFVSDESGKTYKTDKAVTIPGYKTQNGKIIPGQVVVGITAFLSGDSYNGSPTDFTINAFKNTAKAKKIYAKGKTAMTGGAEGLTYTLGTEDKGKLDSYVSSTLKNNLLKKINAQIPPGYILYPNATTYSYQVDQSIVSPSAKTQVKVTGTLSAILLNKEGLSAAITKKLLPDLKTEEYKEIEIKGLDKLEFNFINTNEVITKDIEQVGFKLKGTLDANWHPNIDTIKAKLSGISKSKVQEVFIEDPGILDARVKLFPSWQSYLPNDVSKLHVIVE
jgi:hypothetical protein